MADDVDLVGGLNSDQTAIARLAKALADEDGVAARTGRRWGWSGYNKLARYAGVHRTLIRMVCLGKRKASPATKAAIIAGLEAEIDKLQRLKREFKREIK